MLITAIILVTALISGFNTPAHAQHLNAGDASMWMIKEYADSAQAPTRTGNFTLSNDLFYRPDQPTLHRSAVKIQAGGGTNGSGAVVSEDGLLLTSHFLALQALSRLSSPRRNIIKDGYAAGSRQEEIPLHNYSILVPLEQRDVTRWVTSRIPDQAGYSDSIRAQQKLHRQLKEKYKQGDPDIVVQIKGTYGGNRQLMVKYRRISDIRLVQVPPAEVGQSQGPDSYHEWPRYSGSYALLRAYVSPDGTSRPYNKNNEFWQPDKWLSIDTGGLQPDAPYIALGYPGTTYRLQSSYAYDYYQTDLNPYIHRSLVDIVDGLEQAADNNSSIALKNWAKRSSMQRSLDYYQGVKEGFESYDIIAQKESLEEEFRSWVKNDSVRNNTYGRVLSELEKSYRIAAQNTPVLYTALYTMNHNKIMRMARLYHSFYEYVEHPDSLSYSDRKRRSTYQRHRQMLRGTDTNAQTQMLTELLLNFYELPENNQLPFFYVAFENGSSNQLRQSIQSFLQRQRDHSILFDTTKAREILNMPPEKVQARSQDSLLQLFESIYNGFQVGRKNHRQHQPYLRPAQRYFIEGIHRMREIPYRQPDANGTLRLSTGTVRGIQQSTGSSGPATYTTLEDLIQWAKKNNRSMPDYISSWHQKYRNDQAVQLQGGSIHLSGSERGFPITAITSLDITDGSTGGPIISEEGQLSGISLENNQAGIIGNFYIDSSRKRAISVDIRYVLALIDHYDRSNYVMPSLDIDS